MGCVVVLTYIIRRNLEFIKCVYLFSGSISLTLLLGVVLRFVLHRLVIVSVFVTKAEYYDDQ